VFQLFGKFLYIVVRIGVNARVRVVLALRLGYVRLALSAVVWLVSLLHILRLCLQALCQSNP